MEYCWKDNIQLGQTVILMEQGCYPIQLNQKSSDRNRILNSWLGGNTVTIKNKELFQNKTLYFVYKLTHCGSMWASVNPSSLSLHSYSISKSNSWEEWVFSLFKLTVPPHICACFEDFHGNFYSTQLVLSLWVFFIYIWTHSDYVWCLQVPFILRCKQTSNLTHRLWGFT